MWFVIFSVGGIIGRLAEGAGKALAGKILGGKL